MRNKHDAVLAAARPRVGGGSRRRACMRPTRRRGGITELEQVDFVMKDGQIIKDERPRT